MDAIGSRIDTEQSAQGRSRAAIGAMVVGALALFAAGLAIDAGLTFRIFHITGAIATLAGILGRQITSNQAKEADSIDTVAPLIRVVGKFDRLLVQPGSFIVLGSGIALAWLGGWPMFGFLQGATSNWLLVSVVLYLAIIPLVAFVFVPRGNLFEKALQDAISRGQVTQELKAAFNDNAVRLAHITEAVLIAAILYLMIAKPF